jgi:glycosyltransferase involved in cell wall biosynthesis
MKPLISVIIPVFNHAHTLQKTIECVFRQTYRPFEIIVVNDGSTDDFKKAVDDCFAMIEKECIGQGSMLSIISQENKGAPVARNNGFKNSKGEYVIFWDADTIANPDMLQKMYDALQQHPEASYAYSQFKFGWKLIKSQAFDVEKLKQVNYIDTTSLIRRSALNCHPERSEGSLSSVGVIPAKAGIQSVGPFDPSLKRFQDWDLWLGLLEKGKTGIFVPEVLYSKVVEGRLGISKWMPSFMFKLPWKTKAVRKYEAAREIVLRKHKIS